MKTSPNQDQKNSSNFKKSNNFQSLVSDKEVQLNLAKLLNIVTSPNNNNNNNDPSKENDEQQQNMNPILGTRHSSSAIPLNIKLSNEHNIEDTPSPTFGYSDNKKMSFFKTGDNEVCGLKIDDLFNNTKDSNDHYHHDIQNDDDQPFTMPHFQEINASGKKVQSATNKNQILENKLKKTNKLTPQKPRTISPFQENSGVRLINSSEKKIIQNGPRDKVAMKGKDNINPVHSPEISTNYDADIKSQKDNLRNSLSSPLNQKTSKSPKNIYETSMRKSSHEKIIFDHKGYNMSQSERKPISDEITPNGLKINTSLIQSNPSLKQSNVSTRSKSPVISKSSSDLSKSPKKLDNSATLKDNRAKEMTRVSSNLDQSKYLSMMTTQSGTPRKIYESTQSKSPTNKNLKSPSSKDLSPSKKASTSRPGTPNGKLGTLYDRPGTPNDRLRAKAMIKKPDDYSSLLPQNKGSNYSSKSSSSIIDKKGMNNNTFTGQNVSQDKQDLSDLNTNDIEFTYNMVQTRPKQVTFGKNQG